MSEETESETSEIVNQIFKLSKEAAATAQNLFDFVEEQKLSPQQRSVMRATFYQMLADFGLDIETSKEIAEKFEKLLEKH